jgi:hypothetical protein
MVPQVSQCHALARSGLPPIEPLFNGSLCDDGGPLDEFFDRAAQYMSGTHTDRASVEAVPPLAVPRCAAGASALRACIWLMARTLLSQARRGGGSGSAHV